MTRVLQVLARSAGGIAMHVAQVTRALDDGKDLSIDIAGPADLPIAMPKPVTPVTIPNGPAGGHRDAVRALRRVLESGSYDLVHAHGLRAGIDAAIAARRNRVPVVVTVHNLVVPEIAGQFRALLYRRAEKLAVVLANHCFAVSEDIARHLRGTAGRAGAKVEVLHLGIGAPPAIRRARAEVRAELGLEHAPLIVTASRLAPQKAVHLLLEALRQLDSAVLAVLGQGPLERDLRRMAVSLGVAERVRWLGFRADAADFIAAADVFCLSSIWEGVPLAAQEAILLDTPIVATSVGGMPELITDRVSGRLVPPRDARALADALSEVLSSLDLQKSYTERAREQLLGRFSTERMLGRLGEAYREMAA